MKRIYKRMIVCLCIFLMGIILLPARAQAEKIITIYIDGEEITHGETFTNKELSSIKKGSFSYMIDDDEVILTLDNLVLDYANEAGILITYGEGYDYLPNVNVMVKGENKIHGLNKAGNSYGIQIENDMLGIYGDGTLEVFGGNTTENEDQAGDSAGIYANYINIRDCTVSTSGGEVGTRHLSCGVITNSIAVNSGTLTAKGSDASKKSYGLYISKYFSLTGGSVTATGTQSGICTNQGVASCEEQRIEILGGSLLAKGKEFGIEMAGAVNYKEKGINRSIPGVILIAGGKVEAEAKNKNAVLSKYGRTEIVGGNLFASTEQGAALYSNDPIEIENYLTLTAGSSINELHRTEAYLGEKAIAINGDTLANAWSELISKIYDYSSFESDEYEVKDTAVIPSSVLKVLNNENLNLKLKSKDYTWTVDGNDILNSNLPKVDLSFTKGESDIPQNISSKVAKERDTIELSFLNNNEFGFIASVLMNADEKNAGKLAELYSYNEKDERLLYMGISIIDKSGNVQLQFSKGGDYLIVIKDKGWAASRNLILFTGILAALIIAIVIYLLRKKRKTGSFLSKSLSYEDQQSASIQMREREEVFRASIKEEAEYYFNSGYQYLKYGKKIIWNGCAFLLGPLWCLYRGFKVLAAIIAVNDAILIYLCFNLKQFMLDYKLVGQTFLYLFISLKIISAILLGLFGTRIFVKEAWRKLFKQNSISDAKELKHWSEKKSYLVCFCQMAITIFLIIFCLDQRENKINYRVLDGSAFLQETVGVDNFSGSVAVVKNVRFGMIASRKVTIPKKVRIKGVDYPVRAIGWDAFAKSNLLEEITLHEGLLSIESGAFFRCNHMKSIVLPNSLQEIGSIDNRMKNDKYSWPKGVFYSEELTTITLPKNLRVIGDNAFNNCVNMKSISLPDGLKLIGEGAFYSCSSLEAIAIPGSVEEISKNTFEECKNLKDVTLAQGVRIIGYLAFYECESLVNINIPDSIETIHDEVFSNCKSLKEIKLPDTALYLNLDSWINDKLRILVPEKYTDYYRSIVSDKIEIVEY